MSLVIGAGQTVLLERDEWGARQPTRAPGSTTPDEGCVDHYLGDGVWTPETIRDHMRCGAILRSVQRYHMDSNGWSDIAYNFAVCPHGVAFTLRGFGRNGANGTAYWNSHTYTVLWLVGAGDPFDEPVRDSMARAARDVMDWCLYAGRAGTARRGHSDIRATACPGDAIRWISHNNWYPVIPPPPPAPTPADPVVFRGVVATDDGKGYWLVTDGGQVVARGSAVHLGDLAGAHLNAPVVGIEATPRGDGYWLVAADGGIFTFGKAEFRGSMGGRVMNAPVVGMERTLTGRGYWLVGGDGGIFTFGDAKYLGSGVS